MGSDSLTKMSEWVINTVPYGQGELLWAVLMFIVALSALVFFHELGHYAAARSIGARVEAFSIGFGPKIFGWKDKHGTEWKVSAVPLGGYVSIFGFAEDPDVKYSKKDKEEAFFNKNVWGRMWVVFAGPLANFVLAWVILSSLFVSGEQSILPKVGGLMDGMPAQQAGVQKGDLILSINDKKVQSWMRLTQLVREEAGNMLNLEVERDGAIIPIQIVPELRDGKDGLGVAKKVGMIGVSASNETTLIQHNPLDAVVLAAQRTYLYSSLTVQAVANIFTQKMSADALGGPLMIGELAGKTAQYGWYPFFMFVMSISISLGLINLVPIPMLDGGHLLFYLIEAAKGSPVNEVVQEWSYRFGMLMLGALMIFVFYNDISRLITNG